jgi:hypothetical protein
MAVASGRLRRKLFFCMSVFCRCPQTKAAIVLPQSLTTLDNISVGEAEAAKSGDDFAKSPGRLTSAISVNLSKRR